MLERDLQPKVIAAIKMRYPDAIILKNDPTYYQSIPDLLVLVGPKWAMLETKKEKKSRYQPNQKTTAKKLDSMSFCRSINSENFKEVLHELERFFA